MGSKEEVWEDRRLKSNGHGGYDVNVPKSWAEALQRDFGDVVNARIVFEFKDGKPDIRLEGL